MLRKPHVQEKVTSLSISPPSVYPVTSMMFSRVYQSLSCLAVGYIRVIEVRVFMRGTGGSTQFRFA